MKKEIVEPPKDYPEEVLPEDYQEYLDKDSDYQEWLDELEDCF